MSRPCIVVDANAIDPNVALLLMWARTSDHAVVVMDAGQYGTARREGVERHLASLGVEPDMLIMRPGRKVRDVIVKAIFYEQISDCYTIDLVIETDREAAAMWREKGCTTFEIPTAP